jgi:MFS family permease
LQSPEITKTFLQTAIYGLVWLAFPSANNNHPRYHPAGVMPVHLVTFYNGPVLKGRLRSESKNYKGENGMAVSRNPQSSKPGPLPGEGRRLNGFALFSVLTALLFTLFLEALDQTVVTTALPKIISTLQGFDRYIWSVTAYALASITVIPIVGKLSDQFGRKWFLFGGSLIFLIGSMLSGAAQTMDQFIAFRALQGFGAGTGISLGFAIVADIFPPQERAKWGGLFGAVYGISNLVGPTLGGWLTDHGPLLGDLITDNTRWRWVFYLNLPIGLIALSAILIYLPANLSERSADGYTRWAAIRRVDFLGAILLAAATICLLLGLNWGSNQTYDWNSPQVIIILAAAGVLYLLFVLAERFAAEPIMPLDLFGNRTFTVASLLSMLQLMVLVGLIVYMPLYLQGILGESATNAGELVTPLTFSSVVGAMFAGFAVGKLKRYKAITIVAALLLVVGSFLIMSMTASTETWVAVIFMIIAGLGLGPFFTVLTLSVQNSLPRSRLGVGTGAVRFFGSLGGVLGLAVVGTVVNNSLANELPQRLPVQAVQQLAPAALKLATNPQVLVNAAYRESVVQTAQSMAPQAGSQTVGLLNQVFEAVKQAFTVALQQGFLVVLIFSGLALLFTFLFKDVPLVDQPAEAEVEPLEELEPGKNLSNFSS